MNVNKIDRIQKIINSIIFRIILLIYSFVVILINDNFFNWYIYLVISICYIILYFALIKSHVLRLINDFIFIFLTLFSKDPTTVVNFVLIILPIVNSINFSGNKRTFWSYVFTLIVYFILVLVDKLYGVEEIFNEVEIFIPIGCLFFIDIYTSSRTKIATFKEELSDIVADFYLDKDKIRKPHKIYGKLIKEINKRIKKDLVKDIYCFIIMEGANPNEQNLILVNSSKFIWNYSFIRQDIIKRIREDKVITNESIQIDNIDSVCNLFIYTKVEKTEYVFVLVFNSEMPFYFDIIGGPSILIPIFSKISRILFSEKNIQELRNEAIAKLSLRRQYVNRANKTMHFIRNKLGPYSNLLVMLKIEDVVPDKKSQFDSLLKDEVIRAEMELKKITERADYMLEKSQNPFIYNDLMVHSIENLFVILKRNCASYFPYIEINVNVNPSLDKGYVMLNEEGFELFLTDWLNNMAKYKKDFVSFLFSREERAIIILFINDYSSSSIEIDDMVTDLMSPARNEIMKRTTHGLYTIKSTLDEMRIAYQVTHDKSNGKVEFKMILSLNENSDI